MQGRGEAWYVSPVNNKKYYLGTPDDAYDLMRRLSIGISEKEFASWSKGAPAWARGRLYIRPQSHGEAYYVDLNHRWHYLGRANDAWLLFRAQGLGISNSDLAKIVSASGAPITTTTNTGNNTVTINKTGVSDYATSLSWRYNLEDFKLNLPLKSSLDLAYAKSTKVFYYTGDVEPANAREQFYALFFNKKGGDTIISDLVTYGRGVAATHGWNQDQTAEFLLALVQYIPYDTAKLNEDPLQPNYPYETLYKNSGICSDKTFLAVSILRELGYGAAVLDFPNLKHSAAGISCPVSDSLNGSGYCYVETTNYFPLGVVPPQISGGQAVTGQDNLNDLFNAAHLSKMEILQKTSGLVYQGVSSTKKTAAALQAKKDWIESQKSVMAQKNTAITAEQTSLIAVQAKLNSYQASGDISSYNALVGSYNASVAQYNTDLEAYRGELATYNNAVNQYNQGA